MKQLILLSLIFFNCYSYGQIFKKDGTSIAIDETSISIRLTDRKVSYKTPSSKKTQSISYKDLDYVKYKGLKFEAQKKRLKKGKFSAYYLIAETDTKKLYGIAIEGYMTYFEMLITDKDNNVLESNNFMITDTKKHINNRGLVADLIKKHFSDCKEILDRVTSMQNALSDNKNKWAMNFLSSPSYIDCRSN